MTSPRVQPYGWEEIARFVNVLAASTATIAPAPTIIVGVLRGGALPAVMLSHALGVRRMFAIQVMSTADEEARTTRLETVVDGHEGLHTLAPGESVLIVDDVVNTGRTLRAAADATARICSPSRITTAALIWDTVGSRRGDRCPADFVAHSIEAWIDFPWEIPQVAIPPSRQEGPDD
jgi:hypoxanthine phosphoribosyltransferase